LGIGDKGLGIRWLEGCEELWEGYLLGLWVRCEKCFIVIFDEVF
jgi:hypothetical protein